MGSAPAAMAGRVLRTLLAHCLAMAHAVTPAYAEPPRRVVSINVCTDQLAMLLAAPGQLVSVSFLAADPDVSALASMASDYQLNHGMGEEVFLLNPDLVLAGTYTNFATLALLERLGFRVERFAPEQSFSDVRENILRMGSLLGVEERAKQIVAELDDGLQRLAQAQLSPLTVATYASNSYTTGKNSLSEAVIEAAGLTNLGSKIGIHGGGHLPLEVLILSTPEIIANDSPIYHAPALAQENFVHPAYRALLEKAHSASVPSPSWICGGPFNLVAAERLQDAARSYLGQQADAGTRE